MGEITVGLDDRNHLFSSTEFFCKIANSSGKVLNPVKRITETSHIITVRFAWEQSKMRAVEILKDGNSKLCE
jgi:hypothetical protein